MKSVKLNLLIVVGLVLLLGTPAQSQFVLTSEGLGFSVIEGSDGEIFVTGRDPYYWETHLEDYDVLLAKFSPSGDVIWRKALSGAAHDEGRSVIRASDGSIVVTGYTRSFGAGGNDLLLAKFDASGNLIWAKTLGGSGNEEGYCVIELPSSGLVVTGYTNSFGAGGSDLLLAKFNASGTLLWTRTLGGIDSEYGYSVVKTSLGPGIVVTGYTNSFGAGGHDLLLACFIESSGTLLWAKTIGGSGTDEGYSMVEASDGGLVVTGSFGSSGLFAKFDVSGYPVWTKTSTSIGRSVIETSDGGLVVTGFSGFLGKFNTSGEHLWTRQLFIVDVYPSTRSVIQASDGDFVVAGLFGTEVPNAGGLLLARFDRLGNICSGESATPYIDTITPIVEPITPTVTEPVPDTATWDTTVTVLSPYGSMLCEVPATKISIGDVGNDQGRQVRVKWHRCYYDIIGSPITITEYGIWRRIGEDKNAGWSDEGWPSQKGQLKEDRVYPPGDWDFIKTVPARGESTYSTVCPTLGDSTQADSMYWSVFFVSAMTSDPLVYFDSDPYSGYSLDNIAPLPIHFEVDLNSWFTLYWTVPGEYEGEHPISNYDIRYNTVPVGSDTQGWWNSAQPCSGQGFFNYIVGAEDSIKVAKESWNHPHVYFAIKGLDDRPNASDISNFYHFICGDCNGSGSVELGDVVYLISYLYRGGPPPKPLAKGDVNCNGEVNLGDLVYLITYLYKSGPSPCSSL